MQVSKRLFFSMVFAAMLVGTSPAMAEQKKITITGYLPPLTPHGKNHGPNYTLCPEPWLALENKTDNRQLYAEYWHCKPLKHSCYSVAGTTSGYGCSSGEIEAGWTFRTAAPPSANDLRAEIDQKVVMPCLRGLYRGRGGIKTVGEDDAVALIRKSQAKSWEESITKLAVVVQGKDKDFRETMYKLAINQCLSVLNK